jgi:hypothetical protein
MKIDFVRSGGFAGLRLAVSVDTGSMDEASAAKLWKLVEEAGFYDLPDELPAPYTSPDRFEYRVEISSLERGTHTLTAAEAVVPDQLWPLLNHLTALALQRPGS